MSFILPEGARQFFGIKNARAFAATEKGSMRFLMFDAFCCCLLLGLDRRQHGDADQLEGKTFIETYPDSHKSQAEIIAGLLVDAELVRKGIASTDAKSIEKEMVNLLDLTSPTRLSGNGNELLNLYAASGFQRLRSAVPTPDTLEDFLLEYSKLWQDEPDA